MPVSLIPQCVPLFLTTLSYTQLYTVSWTCTAVLKLLNKVDLPEVVPEEMVSQTEAAEAEEEWEALQEDGEFPDSKVDVNMFAERVSNMGVDEKEARQLFESMCPTGERTSFTHPPNLTDVRWLTGPMAKSQFVAQFAKYKAVVFAAPVAVVEGKTTLVKKVQNSDQVPAAPAEDKSFCCTLL